ncbi:hypothetical protein [uncultured Bilophila sp.]|nr:hypothetical protein [uncultured Bilophila sp.]
MKQEPLPPWDGNGSALPGPGVLRAVFHRCLGRPLYYGKSGTAKVWRR